MARYRIFHLRQEFVTAFQEKAPKPGRASLRDSRYEEAGAVEAESPYEAWKLLQEEDRPSGVRQLGVGDVLQIEDEPPLLCTWWGFDLAEWTSAEQELMLDTHQKVDLSASA